MGPVGKELQLRQSRVKTLSARHLREWAQLAVRRDEQRSWGKVLADSTERIEPAGVLTYSLKEVGMSLA